MIKFVRPKKERDRLSTIPLVVENTARMFDNDIIASFRIGKDLPRVEVQYGDELPLNQPSVRLEDIPTGEMKVDSPLAAMMDSVETAIANEQRNDNDSEKPEPRKEEF